MDGWMDRWIDLTLRNKNMRYQTVAGGPKRKQEAVSYHSNKHQSEAVTALGSTGHTCSQPSGTAWTFPSLPLLLIHVFRFNKTCARGRYYSQCDGSVILINQCVFVANPPDATKASSHVCWYLNALCFRCVGLNSVSRLSVLPMSWFKAMTISCRHMNNKMWYFLAYLLLGAGIGLARAWPK